MAAGPSGTTPQLEDEWFDVIQKARIGLGWSLGQTAMASGVGYETLEHWESGHGSPGPRQLEALAAALHLHGQKLLGLHMGRGGPQPRPSEGAVDGVRYARLTGLMGSYAVHGYLLWQDDSPEAVLVDTAYDPLHALEAVLQRRLMLRWIVLTHCHRDHMEAAPFLKAQTGARVAVPQAEWAPYRAHHHESPDLAITAGAQLEVSSGLRLTALATPGHTAAGTSYRVGGLCCVGDALFAGSTGRSMSPESYRLLLTSLQQQVLSLPPNTLLLPGHGPLTTVGEELAHNPFFSSPAPIT